MLYNSHHIRERKQNAERINPIKEAQTMFNYTKATRTMMCCRMLYSRACTMTEEQVRLASHLVITR